MKSGIGGDGMLEIGIRTFSLKRGTSMSNDYREQIALIRRWMKGKIKSSLRETDSTAVYQYYSIVPFYCVEARFIRRMQVGSSVMCVRESIDDYLRSVRLPKFLKPFLGSYMKIFLNSMDYIVVDDEKMAVTLRQEGVREPDFFKIPMVEDKEPFVAERWLDFYQAIASFV